MKAPITQTKAWQNLQNDLQETSFFNEGSGYQYLAILKHTPVGNYLYLPYGPVYEGKRGRENALKSLNLLAERQHAIFIRVEPTNPDFVNHLPSNAKKTKDLSPKETWVLDLNGDKQTIISNFSHGVRNPYNTATKRGLIIERTTDPDEIKHLVTLQHALAKAKKIQPYPAEYLKTELKQPFATLYQVKYQRPEGVEASETLPADGQVIAASLFFDYDGTRYYMQSASNNTYKKLPATVALLATSVIDAKEKGIKHFDFWGIAPEGADPSHPWYAFTRFKKSFGGREVNYAGTYDLILSPAKYKLYQVLRKLNQLRKSWTNCRMWAFVGLCCVIRF